MVAEIGRSFVLKVGNGATTEVFTTVAGARTTSMAFNGEPVDITDKDDAGWRALLENAGVKSVSVSGAGIFKDTASEDIIRVNALAQTLDNYEVVFATGDKFSGAFQITSLEFTGEHNGARQYSLSLESSGVIAFTSV